MTPLGPVTPAQQRLTDGLQRLVARGFLRVLEKPTTDPRTWCYQVTEAGARYVEQGFPQEGYG